MQTKRTKTYIAGDWDNDFTAIDQLYKWKNNGKFLLDFHDAHEYTQARDSSLYCSIKHSLYERLKISHTFVLIVGNQTKNLTKGSCQYCRSYDSYHLTCHRNNIVDYRSYIQYECEYAVNNNLNIIVLYKATQKYYNLCPDIILNSENPLHIPMLLLKNNDLYWNYNGIKRAFEYYGL